MTIESVEVILLWLLILCVILTGTGLRDVQIASKTLFGSESVRVSLELTSIWISGLNRGEYHHQCPWIPANLLKVWIEQKDGERANFLSLELRHPSSLAFEHRCSWFLNFWIQTRTLHYRSPILWLSDLD